MHENVTRKLIAYFDLKDLEAAWQRDVTTKVTIDGVDYTFESKVDVRRAIDQRERDLKGFARIMKT